ncbi:MAG TPA: hypothetical protein VFO60_12415 [Candidatus Dormibacteraeota bacterium]|nr:hypothetical protein [Candidatus Dormibacteraeota bacterium]
MRGVVGRQRHGIVAASALAGLAAALGGCGGGTTTVTVTASATSPAGSPLPSTSPSGAATPTPPASTPTPSGPPAVFLVWAATTAAGSVHIRVATPGGGPARAVATLPAGAIVMAMGHGQVVAQTADHQILTVDVRTGRQTRHPGGAGPLFGGAFDATGHRFAFVDAASPTSIRLDVLDLVADRVTTVAPLTIQFVSPMTWVGSVLAGPVIAGFSDAPQVGARRVDATTGATLATATVSGAAAYSVFADGLHGAAIAHAPLGDEGDAQPGPGPQGPFNTLRTYTIGTAGSTTVSSAAHHQVVVLDGTPDGGTILVSDTSAAGGFAGISMSPDFGLFLVRGTSRTQLAHVGMDRQAGVILQDGRTAVVAESLAGEVTLTQYGTSGSPVTLDAAPGTQSVVGLVPAA